MTSSGQIRAAHEYAASADFRRFGPRTPSYTVASSRFVSGNGEKSFEADPALLSLARPKPKVFAHSGDDPG